MNDGIIETITEWMELAIELFFAEGNSDVSLVVSVTDIDADSRPDVDMDWSICAGLLSCMEGSSDLMESSVLCDNVGIIRQM